jgi:hypothetical protein
MPGIAIVAMRFLVVGCEREDVVPNASVVRRVF